MLIFFAGEYRMFEFVINRHHFASIGVMLQMNIITSEVSMKKFLFSIFHLTTTAINWFRLDIEKISEVSNSHS